MDDVEALGDDDDFIIPTSRKCHSAPAALEEPDAEPEPIPVAPAAAAALEPEQEPVDVVPVPDAIRQLYLPVAPDLAQALLEPEDLARHFYYTGWFVMQVRLDPALLFRLEVEQSWLAALALRNGPASRATRGAGRVSVNDIRNSKKRGIGRRRSGRMCWSPSWQREPCSGAPWTSSSHRSTG